MSLSKQQKQYNLKDGYVLQTKLFDYKVIDDMSYDKFQKLGSNKEHIINLKMNEFCATVDVIDIIVMSRIGSSVHGGTFSKTSNQYSLRPDFLIVYQIPKSSLKDGSE